MPTKKYFFDIFFFFSIYLLVMPKYWGKQIFAHGRFPEVRQKQKTEREKEKEKYSRDCGSKISFFRKNIKFTPKKYFLLAYIF